MPLRRSPDDIQHVRQTADYFRAQLYAQQDNVAASPGAYSFILLQNNMTTGEYIHVSAINVWVPSTAASCWLARTRGNLGGNELANSLGLSPNAPGGKGQLYDGTFPAPALTAYYRLGGNSMPDMWDHPFPAAILAPGQSLVLFASQPNTAIEAGLMWLVMPAD